MFRLASFTVIAIAAWGVRAPALAGPGSDPLIGRAVFTGATTPHATSLSLNPSALGTAKFDRELYAAATVLADQVAINRDDGQRTRDVEIGPGGQIAAIWRALDRITLGVDFRTVVTDQFVEGRNALRYHTLGGGQREWMATAGFAFQASSRFYFGFSVAFDYTTLRLKFARDSALDNGNGVRGIGSDCEGSPCGIENPVAAEVYDLDLAQSSPIKGGYVVNLGFIVRVWRDIWLGVSYHTPPGGSVQSELIGSANITRAPRDGGQTLATDASVYVSLPASLDFEVRTPILAGRGVDLELHAGGRWTDRSRLYAYDVRLYGRELTGTDLPEWLMRGRGLRDTIALWAGVEQDPNRDLSQRVRFGARAGFETTGVETAKTSPMAIAPTSFTLDLGMQLRLTQQVALQLAYGIQWFPTVEVRRSAYSPDSRITCVDGGYDYTTEACSAVRSGYGLPTAAGEYARLQHVGRLALRYDF